MLKGVGYTENVVFFPSHPPLPIRLQHVLKVCCVSLVGCVRKWCRLSVSVGIKGVVPRDQLPVTFFQHLMAVITHARRELMHLHLAWNGCIKDL